MQHSRAGSELALSAGGRPLRAYVSTPHALRGPGVLVVADAPGAGVFERDVCDRVARAGFVALAPLGAPTADALDAALEGLLSRDACEGPRLGALGFGQGGALALELAARSPRVAALALCWPAPPARADALAKGAAACLALYAERDAQAPPEAARALEAGLRAAGRRAAVRVLPGVAAGFLDPGRHAAFDAAAAAQAWDALLGFLRAELA
jgi:carboxymethylenebutenolidase